MQVKSVILVKFGGGLIAPKHWESETANFPVIERLAAELLGSKKQCIVVSGSGNFGHAAVKKYGIENEEGVEKVRKVAEKIGEVVASKINSSHLIITHKTPWGIAEILKNNETPVLYGDVMRVGEIWSGERCIWEMLPELQAHGWKVENVIQASIEEGVWDSNKKIILEINVGNWEQIKKDVGGAAGADVTGGMLHKVEESLKIARKYGIETWIINGGVPGRLRHILEGDRVSGTKICN